MNGMIAWFAKNSVVANLLLVLILAAGLLAVGDLKQEVYADFALDIVTVRADYRGAGPEDVEEGICIRFEEAVQGIEGIKKITTTATEGRGSMVLEIHTGYDARTLMEDVKARIDAIDTFPEEVELPIVEQAMRRFQVINIAIAGQTDLETLKRLGERVRDELTALPDISEAELRNAPPYEISIEVSEGAMRRWHLTFDEVANAVRRFSVDLPGGSIKTDVGEVLLRTNGQAYSGEEYERLPLLILPDGTNIELSDVATVVDGFEEVARSAMLDGKPAVVVEVYRVGDQSVISVSEAVRNYVAAESPKLPDGIEMITWRDNARQLKSRVGLLVENGLTGLLLVFVVLALFLRPRLAFWVTLGIPVTFLGAIALMPLHGTSLNMVTVYSFILVLGIVVDDAIVVGENIHATQLRTGKGTSGAIKGTQQVLVPVTFGVLTTMAAFAPMLFVPGVLGKMIVGFPLIILPTLFFSLVESNLILPSHLSHYKKPRARESLNAIARKWNAILDSFSNALSWLMRRVYRPVLDLALEWRYVTVAGALSCALLTAGMMAAGHIRLIFVPSVDSEDVVALLTMPQDAPAEVTAARVAQIEQSASELRRELTAELGQDPFRHMLSSVGEHPFRELQSRGTATEGEFQGDNLGEVNVELIPSEDRTISSEEIARRWRDKLGPIPGAVELTITHDLVGGGKAIDLQFTAVDIDTVMEVAQITKARLAEYPGVVEVTDSFRGGKPEIELALTAEGKALGLTLEDLGRQVRQGFFGEEAQRIQRGRDDIRVMVRYPGDDRRSLGDLEEMRVRPPAGAEVPFSTVAVASIGRGPAKITRVDRSRSINVQADVDESITTGGEIANALRSDLLPELTEQYPGVSYSFEGDDADFAESLGGLAKGFVVALFVMFSMLAIPTKSYVLPAIILSSVPFGMVGAIWGHWILGQSVSFFSICGMAALAGIVVNDGLVLATFIGKRSKKQQSLKAAVQQAGEARFRAILLTSLTTTAGVTPLLLETSLQAQFLMPMALALASGVLFATVVTLVLVPAQYLILDDMRRAFRWLVSGKPQADSQSVLPVTGESSPLSGD